MAVYSSSFHVSYLPNNSSHTINSSNDQWSCNSVLGPRVLAYSSQSKPTLRIVAIANSGPWRGQKDAFILKISASDENRVLDDDSNSTSPAPDHGGSGDANDGIPPENGGGGDGGGDEGEGEGEGDDEDEKEFGPIMKLEDVSRETEKVGATLPEDILEAAKTTGIRELLLMRYLELQVADRDSLLFSLN